MSLLDSMSEMFENSIYDALMESDMDSELGFEFALEAASDAKDIELSTNDVKAILNDKNPDNIAADFGPDDEDEDKIAEDAEEDIATMEAALLDLEAVLESGTPERDNPNLDPDRHDPKSYIYPSKEGYYDTEAEDDSAECYVTESTDLDDEDSKPIPPEEVEDYDADDDSSISIESMLDKLMG